MSTKFIVKNIVVFLSLLDSQLSNFIDLKSTFLLSVVQTMKKCAAEGERLESCKTTRYKDYFWDALPLYIWVVFFFSLWEYQNPSVRCRASADSGRSCFQSEVCFAFEIIHVSQLRTTVIKFWISRRVFFSNKTICSPNENNLWGSR